MIKAVTRSITADDLRLFACTWAAGFVFFVAFVA